MGGVPPLGYDVDNRRLVPNAPEAKTVRHIFKRFVELGSSTRLVKELREDGVTSKAWTTQEGRVIVSPQDLEVRFRPNGIEVLALELQPEPATETVEEAVA